MKKIDVVDVDIKEEDLKDVYECAKKIIDAADKQANNIFYSMNDNTVNVDLIKMALACSGALLNITNVLLHDVDKEIVKTFLIITESTIRMTRNKIIDAIGEDKMVSDDVVSFALSEALVKDGE